MKQGWEIKMLGDLCQIKTGKKDVNQGNPNGKYPFFTCAREHTFSDSFSFDTEALLIAGNGDVGNVSYFQGKFEAYQRTYVLSDFDKVLPKFLFLILDGTLKNSMSNQKLGNTMPYIKLGMLKGFPIPLPPLPKQQLITALLDETFFAIAKAKANAEQNLKNAKELFQSTFNSFTADELLKPNCLSVADVVKLEKGSMRTGPFGSQLLHGEFVEKGIAVLGIDNAVANEFQWRKRRFITNEKFQQLKKFQVKPGDVLITIMGTCGRCAIVPENIPIAINTKHLCCITLDPKKCLPEFLHYYFLFHPIAQNYLSKKAKGAIMAGLNMGIIKEMPLILPSIKTQQILVQKLQILSSQTKKLEAIYQQKINDLEELKKSVLQKAFSGELIEKGLNSTK